MKTKIKKDSKKQPKCSSCHGSKISYFDIPQDKERIILVGNPNVGKSAVFNKITGRYVDVSNFPGTTIDINYGYYNEYLIIDTPGVYSISSFNEEEIVTRDIVMQSDKIINVVDAMHLDRDLFLTQQLIDLGKKVLVVLNMIDEVRKNKIKIDVKLLEKILGVKVIEFSANRGIGLDALKLSLNDFKLGNKTESLVKKANELNVNLNEYLVKNEVYTDQDNCIEIQNEMFRLRREYIDQIISKVVKYDEKTEKIKKKISEILLNPITGYPLLFLTIYLLYYMMGVLVAQKLVDITMNKVMKDNFATLIIRVFGIIKSEFVKKLLIGEFGLFTMLPVIFLGLLFPLVLSFYFFMGILEDSGYLPRIATLIDKFLNKIGLNGRAIIPIILGFGCVTMATVTTRILGSKRERIIATFLLGLTIPCSAQLGIITGLIAKMGFLYLLMYVLIIITIFGIVGKLINNIIPGASTDLFIDLPTMRIPQMSNVIKKTYYKTKNFLKEALPIFTLSTLFLGFLDSANLISKIEDAAKPLISGFLKLPPQMAEVFILSIIRRDYGAAGLVTIPTTKPQMFVALVTTTLFVPCITSFVMMSKENGFKNALAIWISSAAIAILTGGIIANIIM